MMESSLGMTLTVSKLYHLFLFICFITKVSALHIFSFLAGIFGSSPEHILI